MHTTIHSNRQSSLPKMHILEEAGVPRKKPLQAKGVPPVLVWIVQTSHRKARVCIRFPQPQKMCHRCAKHSPTLLQRKIIYHKLQRNREHIGKK